MVGSHASRAVLDWRTDSALAEVRQAPWLLSSYADDVIKVASADNLEDTKSIDLRYPLADGRVLTEVPSLCRPVREYLFWVRDDRYGRVQDASTHASMVGHMLHIVHAMTVREIWSFGDLQSSDVEDIASVCVGGLGALTESTRRLGEYLAGYSRKNLPPTRLGRNGLELDRTKIVRDCHLPAGVAMLASTTHVLDTAANELKVGGRPLPQSREAPHLTAQNVRMYLAVFESLFEMRHAIEGEGLSFKPFKEGASSRAAQLGRGTDRTPIPTPKLVLAFLEGATRFIVDQSGAVEGFPVEESRLEPRFRGARSMDRTQLLACSCFVLIEGFSARRPNEVMRLGADCLAGNGEYGWYLHVYISKNLRRMEWIPIPAIVARAVQILIRLSGPARQITGKNGIFQALDDRNGKPMLLRPTLWINRLATEVGVPLHVDRQGKESVWRWQPRQFRRFFAVLYFYRYEGPIEVLSHHLRHFNLNLTRAYVTLDPEVAALWHQEEWGYQGHVARAIVAGERVYSGGMGKRLTKLARRLKDRFRRLLHVAPEEKAAEAVQTMMARKGLVLTPKRWVLCTCPGTADGAARAACRVGTENNRFSGPDFARAGPTVCPACPWAMHVSANDSVVKSEMLHLAAAVRSGNRSNTVFGEIEEANLIKLQRFDGTAVA